MKTIERHLETTRKSIKLGKKQIGIINIQLESELGINLSEITFEK